MAEAVEESFSLDEFETSFLENAAARPNVDNITTCSCKGHCLREKGRNYCPCRDISTYCSSSCHGEDFGYCMNNRRVQESDSDETDSDFSTQGESDDDDDEDYTESRGQGRGRGRGTERGRGTGRGRGRGRGKGEARGRGRGQRSDGGQGRCRGNRGRGRLDEEQNAAENQANHDQELVNLMEAMDINNLRQLAIELLRRQPAAYADVVNGELVHGDGFQPYPQPDPQPDNNPPEWCNCGHCASMPTQEENKCCTQVRRPCITRTNLFRQLVLDGNVLELQMRYREDVLVLDNHRNNENFRHAAYRQCVLWQHGRLERGNRRVVPSCCVLSIRLRYPSPNGIYRGYMPARL